MVVLIISLLAMLSVPAISIVKRRTKTSVIVNDFRTFADAFIAYAQETGGWPPESGAGVVPPVMNGRLNSTAFRRTTPMGGKFNWENNQLHAGVRYQAAISIAAVSGSPLPYDVNQLLDIDRRIDDGNLTKGNFIRGAGNRPLFIIQP